jgi:hypothetical protein
MTFPLITSLRQGSGWQARMNADVEPRPISNRVLQEPQSGGEMSSAANRWSDSEYSTEGNQGERSA